MWKYLNINFELILYLSLWSWHFRAFQLGSRCCRWPRRPSHGSPRRLCWCCTRPGRSPLRACRLCAARPGRWRGTCRGWSMPCLQVTGDNQGRSYPSIPAGDGLQCQLLCCTRGCGTPRQSCTCDELLLLLCILKVLKEVQYTLKDKGEEARSI